MESRHLQYVVGIDNTTGVWEEAVNPPPPIYQLRGRPKTRHYDLPEPKSVLKVATSKPQEDWQEVAWRKWSKGILSNLPENTTLNQLVYMAKIRWWIEQNYQQLKEEL